VPRPDRTPTGAERAAKVAQIQKANASKERRRGALIWGAAAMVIVLIIGAVAVAIVRDSPATADLSAVKEMDPGSADHVTDEVQYDPAATSDEGAGSTGDTPEESTDADTATAEASGSSTAAPVGNPPTGGAHHPAWWDCGVYPEPVPAEHAVHSMEHGAVWLTYLPTLPAEEVAVLEELGQDEYMLVSPYEGQDAPVVATSWGHQLELENADEKTLKAFIRDFRQGPDTPEPGAACTGGTTTDLVERP
jgi:hypothetical protein